MIEIADEYFYEDLADDLLGVNDIAADGEELYEHFRVEVDKGQEAVRIDKFLFERMQHSSRTRIQKAADAGSIYVNGTPVISNYKPAGLVVHPGAGNFRGTLINAIAWHLRDLKNFDPNDPAVGLVHRIDKDTSGLLLIAKTPDAKTFLGKQFFNKTTHRSYVALVWGNFTEDEGRIEGNIGRDPKDRLRMKVFDTDSGIGKPAVTHYKVLERFGYTTLIECILETGRTHQIRAHMKHIGHPLFGDERYGGTEILRGQRTSTYRAYIQNCFKLCNRQALHAKTLGFVHPRTGEQMDFTSELPDDLSSVIEKWRNYINGKQELL